MPYITPISIEGEITLHLWQITESETWLAEECERLGYNVEGILAMKCNAHKCEKLVELILLSRIFHPGISLEHNNDGSPFVNGIVGNISISHSHGLVGIAYSASSKMGLDIESVSEKVRRVRSKFISDDEAIAIAADDLTAHMRAWTAKEALFKSIPENEIDFKEHLHLCYSSNASYEAYETRSEFRRKYKIIHLSHSSYVIAVAIEIDE